ncbi:DUF6443 domain-containing protein [Bacteroides sp.]|uniref:DUF6443 domain-containing protein n=1 Tax=Bacteroides sp. TaxID=29523 RepID=UPI0025BD21EE|nr:DUF6443 domain-containing protein [Bacteroides sp.]
MNTNKIISFLIGLFVYSSTISAQHEEAKVDIFDPGLSGISGIAIQAATVMDTLDLGFCQTPFSFTETLNVDNNNYYWRVYKITLPNFTKIRMLYSMGIMGIIKLDLYDANMKQIEAARIEEAKGETIYTRELSSGTYYFCYQLGRIRKVTTTVECVVEPDAAVQDSHNCLRTRTMTAKDGTCYMENMQYFDAFGRLYESIDVGITPTGKDLAALIEYDEFGREKKKWLPAVVENNNGKYVPYSSLKNLVCNTYENDREPYEMFEYENSPLNRMTSHFMSGMEWHNRAERIEYKRNDNSDANEIDRNDLKYNPARYENGIKKDFYPHNLLELKFTQTLNGQTIEYTDIRGRTVLFRNTLRTAGSHSNDGSYADVQYLYDDIGNLLYVYTPSQADNLTGAVSSSHYIYGYQYDYRDRRIAVRIPQCEWNYYVYDRADRLIFSQNGEQRTVSQWTFYKYDTMGRKVLEGTCTTNRSHAELRTLCQTMLVEESFDRTQPYGYTWSKLAEIIPSDSPILDVYYYDNYDILGYQSVANYTPNFKGDTHYTGNNEGYESKGLLTVSSTAILGNTTSQLHKLHYYDRMEQEVATISDIYSPQKGVEDYKQAEYLSYTFAGDVSSRILCLAGKEDEKYDYTYDHAGRLVSTRYNLFSNHIDFQRNTYDELGRLASITPLGLSDQTTTYTYDIQSRMTSLKQKYFGEELTYTLSGNISKQTLQDGGSYTFTYDLLSRLTQADYANGMADRSCSFSYDKNGNLLSLKRFAGSASETINMSYGGDRMYQTTQSADFDDGYTFKRYANNKKEYAYNTNGSLVSAVNRGISSIKYNQLNLPEQMDVKHTSAEARNEYTYDAEGNKLNVKYRWNPQFVTNPIIGSAVNESMLTMSRNVLYQGNHIWFDTKEMWLNEIGYRHPDTSKFYFYVKDHQGNNRVVIDQNGQIVQRNDYYPYGLPMGNAEGVPGGYYADKDGQPFKYNEKELDRMHGMTLYDYNARTMDPTFPRFLTVDPSCEKYYGISLYAYCANNFVNAIDPDGRDWYRHNETGNYYWREGHDELDGYTNVGSSVSIQVGEDSYFNAYQNAGVMANQAVDAFDLIYSSYKLQNQFIGKSSPLSENSKTELFKALINRETNEIGLKIGKSLLMGEMIASGASEVWTLGRFGVYVSFRLFPKIGRNIFNKAIAKTTTRIGRDGKAVEVIFEDGSKLDINATRVKEWVPKNHPNAPNGTLQKVKFEESLPGSKGYKRAPTVDEINFLNGLFK